MGSFSVGAREGLKEVFKDFSYVIPVSDHVWSLISRAKIIFLFLVVPFIPASDADVVQHCTGYSITYCKWYSTVKSFQEYSCFASLISGPRYGELFRTCSCSPLVAVESTPLELPGRYNGHRTTIRLAEE